MGGGAFPEAQVHELPGVRLRSPTVFAGFVGAGLAGPLAAGHIAESLGMREIGYMRSRHLPPSTVFMSGRLRHPFRFHATADGSVCAVVCEITLRMEGVYSIVSGILDWAEGRGAGEIVILDGVAGDGHDGRAYCAAEEDLCRVMADKDIDMIPQGFITGVPGGILNECLLRRIRGVTLLARADRKAADPEAAATLVGAVNRVYGTGIDTSGLLREREKIGDDFRELSERYVEHRAELAGMYM